MFFIIAALFFMENSALQASLCLSAGLNVWSILYANVMKPVLLMPEPDRWVAVTDNLNAANVS